MVEVKEIKLANLVDCTKACVGKKLPPGLDQFAGVDMQRAKLAFFREHRGQGAGALAAYRDGALVGSLEWYPVELSPTPVSGKDLFVVHCMRALEKEAREEIAGALVKAAEPAWSKRAGVAAVGRNRSWEGFGFAVADRRKSPEKGGGTETLFLKKNRPEAEAKFLEPEKLQRPGPGRFQVDLYLSDRCPWNGYIYDVVRRACASYGKPVNVVEHDCRTRAGVEKCGVGAGIAINGELQPLLRPHLLPDERSIHRLLDLA